MLKFHSYDFGDEVTVVHISNELCLVNSIEQKFSGHSLKYEFFIHLLQKYIRVIKDMFSC